MKTLLLSFAALFAISCAADKTKTKIDVYGWEGGNAKATQEELVKQMTDLKAHNLKGVFYNVGFDMEGIKKASKAAKDAGLEFHAWIPTMVQGKNDLIDSSWYAVSREGVSALVKPAYVPYYTFLCPNREEVYQYLSNKYLEVAALETVDGVHLDYIRYADVILAPGLWAKYGLVMDQEFPQFDYCYCPKCVADFKAATGIDILAEGDNAQNNEQWKQFRYDVVTKFVNRLSDDVHKAGKKISAAVFPGPSLSKKMVRQEWDKWNLDMTMPMLYNDFYSAGPEWVGELTKEGVTALNGKNPLYSGLFICPDPAKKSTEKDPEGHGLLPEEMAIAINGAIDNGAAAICLFTPSRMTEEHWKALDAAVKVN